jgi:hypothetical protein
MPFTDAKTVSALTTKGLALAKKEITKDITKKLLKAIEKAVSAEIAAGTSGTSVDDIVASATLVADAVEAKLALLGHRTV